VAMGVAVSIVVVVMIVIVIVVVASARGRSIEIGRTVLTGRGGRCVLHWTQAISTECSIPRGLSRERRGSVFSS
jgi:hypothetical protein